MKRMNFIYSTNPVKPHKIHQLIQNPINLTICLSLSWRSLHAQPNASQSPFSYFMDSSIISYFMDSSIIIIIFLEKMLFTLSIYTLQIACITLMLLSYYPVFDQVGKKCMPYISTKPQPY